MELNLVDPEDVPRPRDEVRLRQLAVTPLPDGRRLRIEVQLTPFLERPTLDLDVLDPVGQSQSRTTVVEADTPSLSLTMHLRGAPQPGEYTLRGSLSYDASPPQDVREERFTVEMAADGSG